MSVTITNEIHSDYVEIHCVGEYEIESVLEVYSTAFDLAADENLDAILVDGIALQGPQPTTMERYRMGNYIAQRCLAFGKYVRIAVVSNVHIIDPNRFGETVARNRGGLLKVFTKIEEAITWLKEEYGK